MFGDMDLEDIDITELETEATKELHLRKILSLHIAPFPKIR